MAYWLGLLEWIGIWVALMTSALSLFREALSVFAPGKFADRKVFWACIRIAFIVSAALAWIGEHHHARDLELQIADLSKPNFRLKVVWVMTGLSWGYVGPSVKVERDIPDGVFLAEITNSGAPSSVVMSSWRFEVKTSDGVVYHGTPASFGTEDVDFCLDGGMARRFSRGDELATKAANVIPRNGSISGALAVQFPRELTLDKIRTRETEIQITATDAAGNAFSALYKLGEIGGGGYLPELKYPTAIKSRLCSIMRR
jgi:hypothetical protein